MPPGCISLIQEYAYFGLFKNMPILAYSIRMGNAPNLTAFRFEGPENPKV